MNEKIYIIAEAAQGYEGCAEVSSLLVRGAKAANASAIKFQIVAADDLAAPDYEHYELFKSLEMPVEDWLVARELAAELKVDFIADVFGSTSMEIARKIGVDGVKLHSTSFFDRELREQALSLGGKVFLSLGGIHSSEIEEMVATLSEQDRQRICVLFGYQSEPTPIEDNNLARIQSLEKTTGLTVGFMDHSYGDGHDTISLSVLALGLGVRVFEKHITLDRALEMEDYISALGPLQFREYTETLHRMLSAMGSADLALTDEEKDYRQKVLKRVVSSKDIEVGEVIRAKDILFVRTGDFTGCIDPAEILGKKMVNKIDSFTSIETDMVTND